VKTFMKQWQLTAAGREQLRLAADVPIPRPGRDEVLVKVACVALNNRDVHVIDTGMGLPLTFPLVPASDMAGNVVACGVGVARVSPGDRVISTFFPGWIDGSPAGTARIPQPSLGGMLAGVLSEYVVLPAESLVRAPASLDDSGASTLPCAGLTAWSAFLEHGAVKAGEYVLVHGTGGVALFGIQLAKAKGARVIVVSSSSQKFTRVQHLGADYVFDRHGDWVTEILQLTHDRGVDHVLETVGGANLTASLQALAPGGRVSFIGVLGGFELTAPVALVLPKQASILGVSVGHRRALENLVQHVDRFALKPVIDARYRFEDLHSALAHVERGAFGKVVIDVA
jgi:NADPH:quinone reductase-like Zn-dependent oxidoreductase